ncbi:hypothetical protein CDAR_406551 [Caerostris darwini]|uniref:Uncharacterized protein n=1 Tax=Caerostris darwini TaxID=1538125 RepID=A0AAV4PSL9_9ARAC|nr:hypothetical protein CDAR_406551 [Caerostris darwini]
MGQRIVRSQWRCRASLMAALSQKKREGHFLIGTSQELTILLFRPGKLGLGGFLEWLLSCLEKTASYIMMDPSRNKRNATSAKREKPFADRQKK